MKKQAQLIVAISLVPAMAAAQETRELDAHAHGFGTLDIAVEGNTLAMSFEAPGADIVGFEYAAKSEADRELVDAAISDLARPLDLFVFPAEAGCTVTAASVSLLGEDDEHGHDDDHHDEHAEGEHSEHDEHHEEHAEGEHAEGEEHHDEHAEGEHAEGDEHHEEHAEGEHGHDDHDEQASEEAVHSEFHADYTLNCAEPTAIDSVTFAYFDRFPNAEELKVQMVSEAGAQLAEVGRENPVLDMREMF